MAIDPLCTKGHLRTERPNGDLVCRICHNANRDRRAVSRAGDGTTGPSVYTGARCMRGHRKVRQAHGALACQWCDAARRREVRRLQREGECRHVGTDAFEGVLNMHLQLVCLRCVAEGLAA